MRWHRGCNNMNLEKTALGMSLIQIKRLENFDQEFRDFVLSEDIKDEAMAIRLIAEFKEIVTNELTLAQQLAIIAR